MNEEFREIPTWNGIYQVSNYGTVRNTQTKHILKGYKTPKGYTQIVLGWKGRRESWLLHDLVCTVWNRPLKKGEDAHHKIKDLKCCNCIWNLEIKKHSQHLREHKLGIPQTEQHIKNRTSKRIGQHHSQQTKMKMRQSRLRYLNNIHK